MSYLANKEQKAMFPVVSRSPASSIQIGSIRKFCSLWYFWPWEDQSIFSPVEALSLEVMVQFGLKNERRHFELYQVFTC